MERRSNIRFESHRTKVCKLQIIIAFAAAKRPKLEEVIDMKVKSIQTVVIVGIFLAVQVGIALSAQDKYTLKAPNGVVFSEFKGYEDWQDVAVSQTDDGIKVILGNPAMIKAYREGIPGNGKPFPDGAGIAKIEWSRKKSTESPYSVEVPDNLKSVAFIKKDSKRFPDTSGWGYAQFVYDSASHSFKPFGADASFAKTCYQCHTRVKAKDFIFTGYPLR
jgi:hypothetical protein